MQHIKLISKRGLMAIILPFFLLPVAQAQKDTSTHCPQWLVSVFNTATLLPGHIFSKPVHPGITLGAEFRYNHHPRNQWLQTAKLGFSYHQYAQSVVQLYSEFGYRRDIWKGIGAELRIGAGYLHAFPATEIFKFKDGQYVKKTKLGRPQFMGGAALALGYQLPGNFWVKRIYVEDQFYLQMPFVKNYVPLLPNSVLHVGVGISLKS
ncbi:MAG: hypothetical protein LCH81_09145 [Bacteroidetes bacterium]|nr:hypothetical protein [Bacteroidota bacterium]